jgi:hypothetical protein
MGDAHALTLWQQRYLLREDREMVVTGRFDGPTQRAAIALQRKLGLPITALVDNATWDALWATETAENAPGIPDTTPKAQRGPEGPPGEVLAKADPKDRAAKITKRNGGGRPPWMTKNVLLTTAKSRAVLSMPNATQDELAARLRGVQTAAGLAVTGMLDVPTAWVLDEMAR